MAGWFRKVVLAICVVLPGPALAETDALEVAWRDWAMEFGITTTAIAIGEEGITTGVHGMGMSAARTVPLASLSKAITASCLRTVLRRSEFDESATLAEVFEDRPDLMAPDAPGATATLAGLMTHTAGLWPDGTQNPLNPTIWFGGPDQDRLTRVGLMRPRAPEGFRYNNVNYAVLGSVIETLAGRPVEEECRETVLAGLASAEPDAQLGGGLAWGGWSMTLADYYQFFSRIDADDLTPTYRVNGNVHYGPGVLHQTIGGRTVIWHSGALCLGRTGHSSLAIRRGDGTGAVVWVDRCMTADQLLALDEVLSDVLLAE